MNKSEQINELAVALNKVQAKLGGAKKDAKNPFFKSDYATLHSAWEACRPLLDANGLSVVQIPDDTDDSLSLETILMHTSGQWISGRLEFKIDKKDPQKAGSAITYARRYCLMSILGICPEDDDAESVVRKPATKKTPAQVNIDERKDSIRKTIAVNAKEKGISQERIKDYSKIVLKKELKDLDCKGLEQLLGDIREGKVALDDLADS